ncbi:hypothetical protein V1477_019409 [Vespula maculifrons]|uniref:Uncharacterized protein n=1 Tax=Vespula maculifrons TaxID=7453 RepID=A0ABD2ASG4_VESMC
MDIVANLVNIGTIRLNKHPADDYPLCDETNNIKLSDITEETITIHGSYILKRKRSQEGLATFLEVKVVNNERKTDYISLLNLGDGIYADEAIVTNTNGRTNIRYDAHASKTQQLFPSSTSLARIHTKDDSGNLKRATESIPDQHSVIDKTKGDPNSSFQWPTQLDSPTHKHVAYFTITSGASLDIRANNNDKLLSISEVKLERLKITKRNE